MKRARLWKASVKVGHDIYVVSELVARDAAEAASEAENLVRTQKLGGNEAVKLRTTTVEET
jgi:hypothetical protein